MQRYWFRRKGNDEFFVDSLFDNVVITLETVLVLHYKLTGFCTGYLKLLLYRKEGSSRKKKLGNGSGLLLFLSVTLEFFFSSHFYQFKVKIFCIWCGKLSPVVASEKNIRTANIIESRPNTNSTDDVQLFSSYMVVYCSLYGNSMNAISFVSRMFVHPRLVVVVGWQFK